MIQSQYCQVQKAELNGYNISDNLRNIKLFNNIDNIGFTLFINYNDISDIKNKMPLRGGEELELIILDNNDNEFNKSFILFNIESNRINEQNNILSMRFISKESFLLSVKRDYNSYNSTIFDLVNSYQSCECITPDTTKKQIIIPGFSYTKAIKYVTGFVDSYFFFETNTNYRFENISDLVIDSDKEYTLSDNNPLFKRLILDIYFKDTFNTLEDSYNNLYNRKYFSFNPNTKSIENKEYLYKTIQEESKTFGTGYNINESFTNQLNTRIENVPYYLDVFNSNKDSYRLFDKTVRIVTYGDLSLNVGDSLRLNLRDRFNSEPSRESGLYLISKISHHFSNSEYICNIELKKNSPYKDQENNIYKNSII